MEYDDPRNQIKVMASLYNGNNVVKSKKTYAGNILSENELSILDSEHIESFLLKKNINKINSGEKQQFMVVSFDLSENLTEFSAIVDSSVIAE